MLEFHPHASSSAGNFYTVTDQGFTLAIECGIRFKEIQKALQFRVSQLDGVLISHAHSDHARATADMMKVGVDCYASKETWSDLHIENHRAITVGPMDVVCVSCRWQVTPFDVVHDAPGCLGYLIEGASGEAMAYITDSCYSPYKFPPVKILAIEANHSMEIMRENAGSGRIDQSRFNRTAHTHFSIERVIDMLKANDLSKLQRIFLLHLSRENSDAAAFKIMVEKATGIPTTVCDERSAAV